MLNHACWLFSFYFLLCIGGLNILINDIDRFYCTNYYIDESVAPDRSSSSDTTSQLQHMVPEGQSGSEQALSECVVGRGRGRGRGGYESTCQNYKPLLT